MSERVFFAEFEWKYHNFLNVKEGKCELKILLFNYWNDLALGSVETFFLGGGAYVSLERVNTGIWEVCFCWVWMKISYFLNINTEEWHLQNLLFNYWNDLALGSAETYFLGVGAYVSLKRAITGLWEGRFCCIWAKIQQFFKYKNGRVGPTNFIL